MDTTIVEHHHQDDAGLERLQDLQERYANEIMGVEERCEVLDRIQKLTLQPQAAGR